jgi:hypothetical protein
MKNNYSTLSNTYNSKQPPIIYQPEVFYYSNGNLGFSFEDAKIFEYTNDWNWQIASPIQILDSYREGADIDCSDDNTCLWWGWGLDGIQYGFSRPSFYSRKSNENCGIFLYGIKPTEVDYPNCLKTTNQACVLPWCIDKNQWSKYSSPPITCYTEGENPFDQKCSKSFCCDGTTLRQHPADDTHKEPYYICSSNPSYKPNIPPKCDPKTTNPDCLKSFCNPSFFRNKPEVFYYNNGNLGFTFEEAKNIAFTKQWQIATVTQIWDAYKDSADINTCMWGWGHEGFKYWFTRTEGILCGEYKSPGFYYEQAGDNEKCGIFVYGIKQTEVDYPNCLKTTTNQACVLPWDDRNNQWSKYSSPPITCYTEGENPFQDKCSKSFCCDGTTLRQHPADDTHKEPYYICSSNSSYTPNIPKCDPKTTNPACLKSSFCQK